MTKKLVAVFALLMILLSSFAAFAENPAAVSNISSVADVPLITLNNGVQVPQLGLGTQIQSLERELGVTLMVRERRNFSLTPAGEHFYKKSLVIVSDYDRLCEETMRLAHGGKRELTIGYLRHYQGRELKRTVAEFREKHPEVLLSLIKGTHEELYDALRGRKADLVFSDLRRKTSDRYINYYLTKGYFYAEVTRSCPLAQMDSITMEELKNTPCILIAPKTREVDEEIFYREYLGAKSEFLFADSIEEAHLLVATGRGYLPVEFNQLPTEEVEEMRFIPVLGGGKQLYREYYAFWPVEADNELLRDFAEILRSHFPTEATPKITGEEDADEHK